MQQHGSERDKASRGSDNADQQDYHQITIEQPVHHDGSEALVKWALVERLIGLALGAREVSEGAQAGNLFALIASARVQFETSVIFRNNIRLSDL